MSSLTLGQRIGSTLYRLAFPVYRPLYSTFKAYADSAERRWLSQNLSAGAVVVDAGANIGIYSRFLAECVGKSGAVHSFEPSPENFAHLIAETSSLPNVFPHQCAVGERSGEQLLYVSDDLNVDHRLFPADDESRKTLAITVMSLDDYFPTGARVDLLKLDIQGYELHALRGATRLLCDNPEIKILLEFWPYGLRSSGSSSQELLGFLAHHQFQITTTDGVSIVNQGESDLSDRDPSAYVNLLAARSATPYGS